MDKNKLTTCRVDITDVERIKKKVLNWTNRFNTFCFLDNHQYRMVPHSVECLIAAGAKKTITGKAGGMLEKLSAFIRENTGWVFGHLGYNLKNEIEKLSSSRPDPVGFPDLFFFEPEVVIHISGTEMIITADQANNVLDEIMEVPSDDFHQFLSPVMIRSRFSRDEYISVIKQLKEHILRGDCYEINYCNEFYSEGAPVDPMTVFKKLSTLSPNPFSALYRVNDQWLICASPERYLRKTGSRIFSQPIKGTIRRSLENDEAYRKQLYESEKDRSENVMVVDLVRNDLSRICKEGTVQVDELFGIYTFPQVHQMISTVSGTLQEAVSFTDIIRATFPMGSMTGAPKKKVLELIEKYEPTSRGIFSGALGYITPEGDFDFNVVIRSILYNARTSYLSFPAGSGITYYSDPEKEWEECLLKAAAMKKVLGGE